MIDQERTLYQQRIEIFIRRLESLLYEDEIKLEASYCKFEPMVSFEKRKSGKYKSINVGQNWGKNWERAWFNVEGRVPEKWKRQHVCARINLGSEGLVYDKNGSPFLGLSFHSIWENTDFSRDRIEISTNAQGGETIDFWIEATAAQLFGLLLESDNGDQAPKHYGNYKATIKDLALGIFRKDIWDLYLDCYVLNDLMKKLNEKSVRRARILKALNDVIDRFNAGKEQVKISREILEPLLSFPASASELTTQAVGHAHIDTAWLWPIDETIRKCGRTFASQLRLIEKYPDYVFGASQAQHYLFVKEHYPRLYEQIKQKVAEGRWEVQGGMWIEADCNLSGGESLVRQLLHGKQFFKDEFNIEVRNLWLPDVFGYSPVLPQILKKSNIDFFLTQKLSWNQFNRFPYHTFIWKGIDGSEVLTHFPPEDNYNSNLSPSALIHAQENFDEKDKLDEFLTLFGIGDGGGGATEEMIESGLREKNLESCPRVQFGSAQDMFDRLSKHVEQLPRWVGELYFELHRGTLTTHAYNKKMNRFMELRLREIEILYSCLPMTEYPQQKLNQMWQKVLLFQFHDIIPGSSITRVYEDCRIEYEYLKNQYFELLKSVGSKMLEESPDRLTIINTLSSVYNRPISLPDSWNGYEVLDDSGTPVNVQNEKGRTIILTELDPMCIKTLQKGNRLKKVEKISHNKMILENDYVLYEFDKRGVLVRAYDKELDRSIVLEGQKGNLLALYEDRPVNWDAWDIDIFYENQIIEHADLKNQEWICNGPVRQGIGQQYFIGQSKVKQNIYLAANSKCLDFETEVDWRETHKMLRVSFEVEVYSSEAVFDSQYGNIKRNTHRNTSWDKAKFEVTGHRFADLSDESYGVALLNDCKYGYKILDNTIDLNLLRAPTMPDPKADRGKHQFTYSIFPHNNNFINSSVISGAAQLNQPPVVFLGLPKNEMAIPFKLDSPQVVLEVIKKAERETAWIIRMFEPRGLSPKVNLLFSKEFKSVFEADLMEYNLQKLSVRDGKVELKFTPFEIKTIKFVLGNQ